MSSKSYTEDIKNNRGLFGFGFSHNNNLDLLNLVILAYAGICPVPVCLLQLVC